MAALQGKEVDLALRSIAPEQIDLLKQLPDMKIDQGPLFATDMVTYDTQKAPFNNLAVRKAIALAIDRQDLVDTVHLGNATPGNLGWIHPKSPYLQPRGQDRVQRREGHGPAGRGRHQGLERRRHPRARRQAAHLRAAGAQQQRAAPAHG